MSSIITRSALIHWRKVFGQTTTDIPADLASVVDGRKVTWAEVIRRRRERQAARLRQIYAVETWRAVTLWVAYFGDGLMGGWHTFLQNLRDREWIDRGRGPHGYESRLMRLFPMPSLFPSWEQWRIDFAHKYQRRTQCGKPYGAVLLWRKGYELALTPHEREAAP